MISQKIIHTLLKKSNYALCILSFALTHIAFGQVNGKLLMDSASLPGAVIKFKDSSSEVSADFDGNFSLPVDSKTANNTIIISYVGLNLEIKNIELNDGALNIGNIELPYFKHIPDLDKLSDKEKENCLPTYCWGQLLGYFNTNKLENEYIILNCKERVTEFEFNSTNKTITVDWDLIKDCR